MPNSPAATPAGSPFQFTPFPFGPPPQPAVTPTVTPSYTGTAPAGTQLFYSSTAVQTVVAQDLGSTLIVGAITGFPQLYPFTLLLEWGTANQEVATVTSAPTGNGPYTYTGVLRGCDGTAQVTHATGAQVNHGVSARDFTQSLITASAMAVSGTASSGQVLTATAANAATWQTGSGGGAVDWINVKSSPYNATGNGSTDDTTAIQAALTAARTATYGGVVYLPAGIYIASQSLQVGSNTVLVGDGIGVTTIRCKASSLSSFTQVGGNTGSPLLVNYGSTTASRIQIGPGITFDGNQANAGGALAGYADGPECAPVALWNTTLATVTGIEVINAIGYSVYLQLCTDSQVTGSRILSGAGSALGTNQQDGIHLTGCTQCRVENNDVDTGTGAAGDDGIALQSLATGQPCLDIVIAGNTVRSASRGISLNLGGGTITNVSITGNVVWTTASTGLLLSYEVSPSGITSNVTIAGNTFANIATDGTDAGIGLQSANAAGGSGAGWQDVVIAGNSFVGCTGSGYGIYCGQGSGLQINDNNFDNWNVLVGIQVGDNVSGTSLIVSDFQVSGNTINMSGTGQSGPAGIAVLDSHDGIIQGNTCVGKTGGGSDGILLQGVSASNLVTGIIVDGNRCTGWDVGVQEFNGGGAPNDNWIDNNIVHGCTTGVSAVGLSTHAQTGIVDLGGVPDTEQWGSLASTYTLASQTGVQKLFNWSTTGALTLNPGTYFWECQFSLTAMSSSTGTFNFAVGGTATISAIRYWASAQKTAAAGTLATWPSFVVTSAASTALVATSLTTTGAAILSGVMQVSVAGTIIPQVAFSTVAGAVTPIVGAGSWFRIWPVSASSSAASFGNWS